MKKKILSAFLLLTVLMTGIAPYSVKADGLQNVGDSSSADSRAKFYTQASDLGGITVSVPETITLVKDEDAFSNGELRYKNDDASVSVYGYLENYMKIRLGVLAYTDFTNSSDNSADTMRGELALEWETEPDQTSDHRMKEWSASQIVAGNTVANRTSYPLKVSVQENKANLYANNMNKYFEEGNYSSTLTFTATNISLLGSNIANPMARFMSGASGEIPIFLPPSDSTMIKSIRMDDYVTLLNKYNGYNKQIIAYAYECPNITSTNYKTPDGRTMFALMSNGGGSEVTYTDTNIISAIDNDEIHYYYRYYTDEYNATDWIYCNSHDSSLAEKYYKFTSAGTTGQYYLSFASANIDTSNYIDKEVYLEVVFVYPGAGNTYNPS